MGKAYSLLETMKKAFSSRYYCYEPNAAALGDYYLICLKNEKSLLQLTWVQACRWNYNDGKLN